MSYQISVFQELKSSYATWDSLQTYLTSPEGGTMRTVGDDTFRVLRYAKGVSDLNARHGKWMRSVIWDTESNLPVCVAPPKAEKGDVPTGSVTYVTEPFLDGMMVNVFRTVKNPNTLQIATRTQIGAGGKFYSEKTFAQLFDEALAAMNFTKQDMLNTLAGVSEEFPASFASFVLQHPEHRVVARCRTPHLWIVQSGVVHSSGNVTINELCTTWPSHFKIHSSSLQFSSETELNAYFGALCQKNGWFYQGLVFKDGKGNRWRMRNPNYLYLRALRGSESTCMERFLRLRSESKVSEYLKHYSEDRQTFWDLEQTLRTKTKEVFDSYCAVHKAHEKKLEDLPWSVRPCVFKLHAHYLEHLRPNNEKVTMKNAVELVNNLALYEQKRLLTAATGQATA
jgi:hypothetical protein